MSRGEESSEGVRPGTRTGFTAAAESIAVASGIAETVSDIIHGRALKHYAVGLSQYIAIRLCNPDLEQEAMDRLRTAVTAQRPDELVAAPGIRARVYRFAREITEGLRSNGTPGPDARRSLRWATTRGTHASAVRAIDQLRSSLPTDVAELLELHHARELSAGEIAFVMDVTPQEIERELSSGLLVVRAAVPETTVDSVPSLLLRAFALEPSQAPTTDSALMPPELVKGTVLASRYEIDACVGTGSFADVYRARDVGVAGHVVALKLLHQPSLSEQARANALRELQLIASVFHPSVVQFKDHGWHEERLWFVMPWYEGETLEARTQRGALGRAEARRIFEPLGRALATMHGLGIRHQDVKPDNIFLAKIRGFGQPDGDEILPVLIDLGVAAKEAEMLVAGTPQYLAPEVAAQFAAIPTRHPVTAKADVFGLALSLRNALEPHTQEEVFGGAVETFVAHRAVNSPDPPERRDLRFLRPSFARWLSANPDERPSADQLADELRILTRPEERKRRTAAVLRWAGPIGVAILLIFGAVVYALNQRTALEKTRAEHALGEAADARADLTVELERRRQLEQEYASSQFTREELASRLAKSAATLEAVERRRNALAQTLEQAQRETERTATELGTVRGELSTLGTRSEGLTAELSRAQENFVRSQRVVAELNGNAEALRSQITIEQSRGAALEEQLQTAETNGQRFLRDLVEARARIAALERQVEHQRAPPQPEGPPPGENPPPPGPSPNDLMPPE